VTTTAASTTQTISATEAFKAALAPYKHATRSVQFPLGQPIPLDLLRRMVEFRVAEMTAVDKPRNG